MKPGDRVRGVTGAELGAGTIEAVDVFVKWDDGTDGLYSLDELQKAGSDVRSLPAQSHDPIGKAA